MKSPGNQTRTSTEWAGTIHRALSWSYALNEEERRKVAELIDAGATDEEIYATVPKERAK